MGRLIDVNEVKKRYPIMENDFGMVVNERLHKELDKIPTVEAIPLSVIDEIKAEIDALSDNEYFGNLWMIDVKSIIDRKVKEYTE